MSRVRALVYAVQRHSNTACNNRCGNVERVIATQQKNVWGKCERRKRRERRSRTRARSGATTLLYLLRLSIRMVIDKRLTASFDPKGSPSTKEGIRLQHPATNVSHHACQNGVFLAFFGPRGSPFRPKIVLEAFESWILSSDEASSGVA